jgi:hypothetical protein
MKFRTSMRRFPLLALAAAGFGLLAASAAAQSPPAAEEPAEMEEAAAPAPEKKDEDLLKDVDIDKLDWSQLNVDASMLDLPSVKARAAAKSAESGDTKWSANLQDNGASSVSVRRSISPFWDARIGADMTVVNQGAGTTSADLLQRKISPNAAPENSSGSAWAAITAPGVGSIWDKTSIEARVDPSTEEGKLGTSISKSLPLSDAYSLSLQEKYNLIQQGAVPIPGIPGRPVRSYETEQSAKLSLTDFGTSLTAAQALSSTDDKWLRSFGAEQKLYGDVSISGSVGETSAGTAAGKISAGYKKSW